MPGITFPSNGFSTIHLFRKIFPIPKNFPGSNARHLLGYTVSRSYDTDNDGAHRLSLPDPVGRETVGDQYVLLNVPPPMTGPLTETNAVEYAMNESKLLTDANEEKRKFEGELSKDVSFWSSRSIARIKDYNIRQEAIRHQKENGDFDDDSYNSERALISRNSNSTNNAEFSADNDYDDDNEC